MGKGSKYEQCPVVVMIKSRLRVRQVLLDSYVDMESEYITKEPWGTVSKTLGGPPPGFAFRCKDRAAFKALVDALGRNTSFGMDNIRFKLGGPAPQGIAYREDNQPDSLHIILSTVGQDNPLIGTCSVHLDRVSPVKGRDPDGKVIYDVSKLLLHGANDLLHTPLVLDKPLPLPGKEDREDGVVFGFRFEF